MCHQWRMYFRVLGQTGGKNMPAIGTNVVSNEDEYFQFLDAILKQIEQLESTHDKNKGYALQKKMIELLGGGGTAYQNIVDRKFAQEIEDKLIANKVEYLKIPGPTGDVLFAVNGEKQDKFVEIQNDVFSKSTDYFKELTSDTILGVASRNRETLTALTCENTLMAEIARNKCIQNGIPVAREGNILVLNDKTLYNNKGGLCGFEMAYAVTQFQANYAKKFEEDFILKKQQQMDYDKNQILNFINAYKNGQSCVLMNATRNGDNTIETDGESIWINYTGQFVNGQQVTEKFKISKTDKPEDILAMLSVKTEDIHNMMVTDKETAHDLMSAPDATQRQNKLDKLKGKGRYEERPGFPPNSKKMSDCMNQFNKVLTHINQDAMIAVGPAYHLRPEQRYQKQKEYALNVLKSKNDPMLQDFLHDHADIFTQDMLNEIINNIENTNQKDDFEVQIQNHLTVEEARRKLNKNQQNDRDKENDKDKEKEKDEDKDKDDDSEIDRED